MKKYLKLSYQSMWPGHNPFSTPPDYFLFCLQQHYDVVIDNKEPDIVICSVFGDPVNLSQYSHAPLVVGYSGESYDYAGQCDVNFGMNIIDDENYHRLPHWCLYIDWNMKNITSHPCHISNILTRHTKPTSMPEKFCNFTYRNPVRSRIEFFLALSRLHRVESTGSLYNNTGYLLGEKPQELKNYKFTIAYENKILPGYVTEKIFEPLAAGSIPIYCGGSMCNSDFNSKAFINASDFSTQSALITHIDKVNSDDNLWLQYVHEPVFSQIVDWPAWTFDIIYHKLMSRRPHLDLG